MGKGEGLGVGKGGRLRVVGKGVGKGGRVVGEGLRMEKGEA